MTTERKALVGQWGKDLYFRALCHQVCPAELGPGQGARAIPGPHLGGVPLGPAGLVGLAGRRGTLKRRPGADLRGRRQLARLRIGIVSSRLLRLSSNCFDPL